MEEDPRKHFPPQSRIDRLTAIIRQPRNAQDTPSGVDAPIDGILKVMKKNGFEPSQENLNLVLDFMEQSYFWMMRGGCDPADVEDYIFMVADMTMTDFIHSGELQSCEMVEDETNAQPDDTSLKEQYYEWCAAHPDEDRQTCGKYGPEFAELESVPKGPLPLSIEEFGDLVETMWNEGHQPPCFFCGRTETVRVDLLPPHCEFKLAFCESCSDLQARRAIRRNQ